MAFSPSAKWVARHIGLSAAQLAALESLSTTELGWLDGITAGTAAANKAVVVDANKDIASLRIVSATIVNAGTQYQQNSVPLSAQVWKDVTVTAALLDSAGTVTVQAGVTGAQFKIRDIRLVGGGTNFGAGGNRLISLTDGTTVWTTIANADIEAAPSATLSWGDTKVPFLTGTSDTASVAGQAIRFAYSGGTTDHSGTGSIKFSVLLEKVA